MDPKALVSQLEGAKQYFDRSTRCLEEKDAGFAPTDGSLTTAQQVAHIAQTIDWFVEGASRPEGFDMDFEGHLKAVQAVGRRYRFCRRQSTGHRHPANHPEDRRHPGRKAEATQSHPRSQTPHRST